MNSSREQSLWCLFLFPLREKELESPLDSSESDDLLEFLLLLLVLLLLPSGFAAPCPESIFLEKSVKLYNIADSTDASLPGI